MMQMTEIKTSMKNNAAVPDSLVRQMYKLLGENMTRIVGKATPGWKSDAEFSRWKRDVFLGDGHRNKSHLLLLDEEGLRGFLSYTAPDVGAEIYLNELQIRPSCQGDGLTLRCFIRGFAERIEQMPHERLRTYSNRANTRVHRLAAKCGFARVGETDRGYQYLMPKGIPGKIQKRRKAEQAGSGNAVTLAPDPFGAQR